MNHLKRIYKLNKTYDIDKLRFEIYQVIKNPNKFINDGSLDEEGFIWFFNKTLPSDWETLKFIQDFNFDMSGIALMQPKFCFSFHTDPSPRIHIAIDTDENNFFSYIDGKCYRIPSDGHAYLINTTIEHTFCNASLDLTRIHLAGHPHFFWSWDALTKYEIIETYG